MDTGAHLSPASSSFGFKPRRGIAGPDGNFRLTFWRKAILFFLAAGPLCIPISRTQASNFPTSSPAFPAVCFFLVVIPVGVRWDLAPAWTCSPMHLSKSSDHSLSAFRSSPHWQVICVCCVARDTYAVVSSSLAPVMLLTSPPSSFIADAPCHPQGS